jgi:hydrogenase 3 maturation protease
MCWQAKLQQSLTRVRVSKGGLRVVILGVGHELRGDDALGVIAVRKFLQAWRDLPPELLCIDAGQVPENFCSQVRDFEPGLLLVIDAARLEQSPGAIAWIEARDINDSSFSTHSLPLSLILGYLTAETGCETAVLGIQPADLSFAAPLSHAVCQSVDTLVCGLLAAFQLCLLNRLDVPVA